VCHDARRLDVYRQDGPAGDPVPTGAVAGPCPSCGREPDVLIELVVRDRAEAAAAIAQTERRVRT
jgi:hypothetical protein